MVANKGFTLVEIMIVVAVIAIFSAIAYPSYQEYSKRAKRVEAQSQLLAISQKLQSYKLANGSYYNATLNKVYGGNVIRQFGAPTYNLLLSTTTVNPTHTWVLTAEPVGAQIGSGALSLNSSGQQCWYKGNDIASGTCLAWSEK